MGAGVIELKKRCSDDERSQVGKSDPDDHQAQLAIRIIGLAVEPLIKTLELRFRLRPVPVVARHYNIVLTRASPGCPYKARRRLPARMCRSSTASATRTRRRRCQPF